MPFNGAFMCGRIDGKLGGLTPMNSYARLVCIRGIKIQSITFEASDRSRSLPLALIHFLASEFSLVPIREIARYQLCLSLNVSTVTSRQPAIHFMALYIYHD